MKLIEQWENFQKLWLCFSCLQAGHLSKDCKSRTRSVPNCGKQQSRFLHRDLSRSETTASISEATTAVASNINQGRLSVVRNKLTNRDLSLHVLLVGYLGSYISFVDKSVVSKLQLQGRKVSLSSSGINGSQDVKSEIVPIAVSAHEKSRPLTTVQNYVKEKLNWGDQIVALQELKDRYPYLPYQTYNLNEIQVFFNEIVKTLITLSKLGR